MPTRRQYLLGTTAAAFGGLMLWRQSGNTNSESFEIVRTDDDWRKILSEDEFAVLRKQATERPFTSPLDAEKRQGVYSCTGCKLDVYASETKFDSGTGWPSFYASLPHAIGTRVDRKLIIERTEVHCRRCGGHLGHIFDDGPEPTGKRHCLNGIALRFRPLNV